MECQITSQNTKYEKSKVLFLCFLLANHDLLLHEDIIMALFNKWNGRGKENTSNSLSYNPWSRNAHIISSHSAQMRSELPFLFPCPVYPITLFLIPHKPFPSLMSTF